MKKTQDAFSSKFTLVLAILGSGVENFLRFPTFFAQYGGWFLVPYFDEI